MFHALTVSNRRTSGLETLERSASRHGIDLRVLGMDREWTGLMMKWHLCLPELGRMAPDDIVLFTDGSDSVFVAGETAILERFATFNHGFVMSAERNCFPRAEWAERFPSCNSPYRFLNSGGWIGRAGPVRELLTSFGVARLPGCLNDQGVFHDLYFARPGAIVLDTQCRLFQCLFKAESDIGRLESDAEICNLVTGEKPVIIHANGGSCMNNDFLD